MKYYIQYAGSRVSTDLSKEYCWTSKNNNDIRYMNILTSTKLKSTIDINWKKEEHKLCIRQRLSVRIQE